MRACAQAAALGWVLIGAGGAAASGVLTLKFAEFYLQPSGRLGLQPSEKLLAAVGQETQLLGWMVNQETPSRGYFLLTPRPIRLSEQADGEADDLPPATVLVRLPPDRSAQAWPHQSGLIEVTGTLHFGRSVEGDGRVSWIQLQLH